MKKLVLIVILLVMFGQVCYASPLNDFTRGDTSVTLISGIHTFEGSNGIDFTISTGLGNDWATSYRQTDYDTSYHDSAYRVKNRELNILRKITDNLQIYTGYSMTMGCDKLIGQDLKDKGVMQVGIIASKKLGDNTTLYTVLGGGENVTNIEFGLSHQLNAGLEITATYRHFTVEKVGPSQIKENLRGFGLGLTFKI